MPDDNRRLVNIWEDTVDLKELFIGLACGSALGFVCYDVALRTFSRYFASQPPGVLKGYALMGGIVGCVCAAVGVALVFKPKRWLRTSDEGPIDRAELVRELDLDPLEERRAFENASPALIREMKQLRIYDLFADFAKPPNEAN